MRGIIMDIDLIKYAIRSSWGADTAYPMEKCEFLTGHPSEGQCAVSAAILQDYIGGTLQKGRVNDVLSHYWNCINGEVVDITSEQFTSQISIVDIRPVCREELMSNASFCNRYQLLKARTVSFLSRFDALEAEIAQCTACGAAVEKFTNRTIYFGNKGDILIVGEAPAKNGWHISGKAWKTVEGRLLPSGKRLNELLALCGVGLFDCNFLETVKCHPQGRGELIGCGMNCYSFLEKQIDLLSPRLILTLGKVPTQILVSDDAPLSKLVGKRHILTICQRNFTVFPIYHPSPASPRSWSDNLLLMPALRAALKEEEPWLEN